MKTVNSIILTLLISGCGYIEYSPWQSDPEVKNLTAKHLAKLENTNSDEFTPFSFALTGDSQAVVEHFANAIDVINYRSDISFTALAGDITDAGLMKEYELVYRAIAQADKPILTVVGNHDGLSNSKKIYKEMFGPTDYSFVYRDIKFIMWNNNGYEWDVDMEFLRRELDTTQRTIVISHQPPNGGALSDYQEAVWQELRSSDSLTASLHGHVHRFSFEIEGDVPIYTVDRVTNSHFAVIEVTDSGIFIQNCTPLCGEVLK